MCSFRLLISSFRLSISDFFSLSERISGTRQKYRAVKLLRDVKLHKSQLSRPTGTADTTASLTDVVFFRMAALHVILEEGGVDEGLFAMQTLEAEKENERFAFEFYDV